MLIAVAARAWHLLIMLIAEGGDLFVVCQVAVFATQNENVLAVRPDNL